MLDPRTIITVLIAVIVVWHFFGFWAVFWCAIAGGLFAFFYFIYLILRSEGKVDWFKKWVSGLWKSYLKIEARFFKWIDSL